jgi:hypothetical protein
MSLERDAATVDAHVVKRVPFWMAAAGGVLLAAASVMGWSELEWVGAILFVAGVLWFFAAAIHRSRSEGIGLVASLTRSAQDALRFAWYLMP